MFTGMIEGLGDIKAIKRHGQDMRLTISPRFSLANSHIGDSVAVNGVCLTITDLTAGIFSADVSAETVGCSTMGLLKQGDQVNLERALRLMDRLGGHLVAGHVDGIGKVLKKEQRQGSWVFRIGLEPRLANYTIEKGSIAIDGISLTINACGDFYFEVNVIPQTVKMTTIHKKTVNDSVNIETDLIGKYVEKFMKTKNTAQRQTDLKMQGHVGGITEAMLFKHGFGD